MSPSALHPLAVDARRTIPEEELVVRATRSGGAGGQHVNTSSTRVEVLWCPARSRVLTEAEKARLAVTLASRLDGEGFVRVVATDTRSQRQNRTAAESRLGAIVRRGLVVPKHRKPTKPSRAARAARLDDKRVASRKKAERRRRDWD